jgi:hypothetical protein
MSEEPLAPDIPAKPRRMKGPVPWLLGPQFLAAARRIARAALLGDRKDPRNGMNARAYTFELAPSSDELWFDFIADSGDSQRAAYAVAALCEADLFLEPGASTERPRVAFRGAPESRLPRGRFLLVGGDTAYHVADHPSLLTRFVAPFVWATRDLHAVGLLPAGEPRSLFGVPGDHDYFDMLDGFHRQFRRPPAPDSSDAPSSRLAIPTFSTSQDASYLALRLPFGWSIWGIDCMGGLDARQRDFFRREMADVPPRKLIVATHFPAVAMGRVHDSQAPTRAAFRALGLTLPFLSPDQRLPDGHARLDLAGDIHHYERYASSERTNYASVVAGIGGAFLHPSHVDHGELPRRAVFPPVADSARLMARRLFSPSLMLSGGYIAFWIGLVSAVLLVCAAIDPGTRAVLGRAFGERRGDLGPYLRGLGLFWTMLLAVALAAASWLATRRVYGRSFISARAAHDAAKTNVWSYRYALVLGLAAVAAPFAGIFWLGEAPARSLLAASLFSTLALGLPAGLAAVGALVGAAQSKGVAPRIGFGALGASHGIAQLATGVILARAGIAWAAGYVVFAALYGYIVGPRLSPNTAGPRTRIRALSRAAPLAGGWALALGMLAVPIALGDGALPMSGWPMISRIAVAAFSSGVLAPLWLGWYLAISLAAGGHYNEAAGAARIERNAGVVRVRVRHDSLTVFVVGLEGIATDVDRLRPFLVDQFEVVAGDVSAR